jgi:hypothetical protein
MVTRTSPSIHHKPYRVDHKLWRFVPEASTPRIAHCFDTVITSRGETPDALRFCRGPHRRHLDRPSCFMKSWLSQNSHSWSIVAPFQ